MYLTEQNVFDIFKVIACVLRTFQCTFMAEVQGLKRDLGGARRGRRDRVELRQRRPRASPRGK